MKPYLKIAFSCCLLFFSFLMIQLTIPYFSFATDVDFLLTKQTLLYNKIWLTSFYLHIGTSPILLLSGVIQFNNYFLINFPSFHRTTGKVYCFLLLFISAPSGLIMAFYANGGFWAKLSFVLVCCLWWWFTWKAFVEIRKRNIKTHIDFMVRSYALTLSAIALRLYTFFFPMFFHMPGIQFYILVSWLSWIPNLMLAEFILRKMPFSFR